MQEEGSRWALLLAPLAPALALCVAWLGLLDTLTLLALSVLTLSGARQLQELWLSRRAAAEDGGGEQRPAVKSALSCLCAGSAGLLLLLVLLELLDDDDSYRTVSLVLANWPLAPFAVILAGAMEWLGTPSSVIRSTLRRHQTLFSDGAAWTYYLGYWAKVNKEGKSMQKRMSDYLFENGVRPCETKYTNTNTMCVLIPTTYRAMLNDADFHCNDSNVEKEEKLKAACDLNGRPFGQSQVYTLMKDGVKYRTAMETASPMRHAYSMVDDKELEFTMADFEEFARSFQRVFEQILKDRPTLSRQLTLVPVSESTQLAAQVVGRLCSLQLVADPQEPCPPPPASPTSELTRQYSGPHSLPAGPVSERGLDSVRSGPYTTHV